MMSWEDIVAAYIDRKRLMGLVVGQMVAIREHYNGDVVVPLPELDQAEKPFVANLVSQGIDQQGMRIASTMPDVYYPPLRPGIQRSEKLALDRRKVNLGWWEMNRLRIKMRRRARWLIAYASAPVYIRPDFTRGIPEWHLRDPLTTYPAPTRDPDEITPPDCIFCFSRSASWLKARYPESYQLVYKGNNPKPDDRFELLEYVDADEIVLGCVGRPKDDYSSPEWGQYPHVELERTPNRAGVCTAVVPGRVTLDRPQGQYDGVVGLYQAQAKLMALEMIAVQRGIFPDTYLVGRAGEQPNIVAGPFDGRSGKITVVSGGDVKELVSNPTYMAPTMIDRLERAQRLNAGIPAEFGGESTSNIRTGRRGEQVLSSVVDFPVQEAQELLGASLVEEDRRAIAVAKGYFDTARSFYVSWRNAKGTVTYTPSVTFETDEHEVQYSHPGTDANNLIIGIGQRIGIGTMSKLSAMKADPLIDDWEHEHDQVIAEGIEMALLQGLQTQVSQGAIPVSDVARIMQIVREDQMDLAEAILTVQQEAQERQAAQVPPGSPEAQPGLAQPGMGAEAGAAVAPPTPSLENLSSLLSSLRKPAMTVNPARVAQGA